MAALPSPTQIAGDHFPMYSALFESVKKPDGNVPAPDAAKLLKKSGLPDMVLGKIWDMSDTNGKGYLNKQGFFIALKLISVAQTGKNIDMSLLTNAAPPPKLGNTPIPVPPSVPKTIDWSISPSKKIEYEQLFESLQPCNGYIPGNKVKSLLLDSKLPVDTLSKIWELADIDKDGSLNKNEFAIAMHLVYKALEKYIIPNTLPPELQSSIQQNQAPLEKKASLKSSDVTWVVSVEEKSQYDILFKATDIDEDGFVSGIEVRNVFLQSGLPHNILANIWALCDIKQCGKLNDEQFALAMWLIKRKISGTEVPVALTPEMVPPSFYNKGASNENNNLAHENPEIEMINKDIEEMKREKQMLEGEVLQKEADVKIKTGETNSLQGELDTLIATLKQLENQKCEAQKRLGDLKNNVNKLQQQADEQNKIIMNQEKEINSKKEEMDRLKKEEEDLKTSHKELSSEINTLDNSLQETQLNISQIKTLLSQISEFHKQLKEATELLDSYLRSGDVTNVSNMYLSLEPVFKEEPYQKIVYCNKEPESTVQAIKESPKANKAYSQNAFSSDPFTSNNNFSPAFNTNVTNSDPFNAFESNDFQNKADPFASADPFDSSQTKIEKSQDDSDPFGCEPFAAPALPPKNKQPPPRPAPPRPQPPAKSPTPQKKEQSDSFADFSTFFPKSDSQNKLDFTEDPFGNYRYEDPFGIVDPFDKKNPTENHVQEDFPDTK